jgi:hypothetical protein
MSNQPHSVNQTKSSAYPVLSQNPSQWSCGLAAVVLCRNWIWQNRRDIERFLLVRMAGDA